ncbi:MAG TPA: endonuclease III, partial [Candidatus Poseidoniales archaeon]
LFELGPTPEAMAALDVDVIQSTIRYVGLAPTKAKNIRRLSEMLVEHH